MPVTVLVTPEERPAMGFALARDASFYAKGTSEQRESAASLAQMRAALDATPPGAVELEFLIQDAYLLGIRLFYNSVELEEYWLDARARATGGVAVTTPDPELDAAVRRYFPDLVAKPADVSFDPIRGLFTDIGIKLNEAVTEGAPRARALYNSDREEMSDKAIEIRERNARARSAGEREEEEERPSRAAVAVASGGRPPAYDWGVDVATGLAPEDIPAGSFRPLSVGSVRLFITNYDGQLAAVDGTCTHQRASLAKGRLRGTIVECPRHGAEFDLRSGKQVCPPFCPRWMDRSGMKGRILALVTPDKHGGDLPQYPLRVENGEIVLRI